MVKAFVDAFENMIVNIGKKIIDHASKDEPELETEHKSISIMLFFDYDFEDGKNKYIKKHFDDKYYSRLKHTIKDKFKYHTNYDITLKIACHNKNRDHNHKLARFVDRINDDNNKRVKSVEVWRYNASNKYERFTHGTNYYYISDKDMTDVQKKINPATNSSMNLHNVSILYNIGGMRSVCQIVDGDLTDSNNSIQKIAMEIATSSKLPDMNLSPMDKELELDFVVINSLLK